MLKMQIKYFNYRFLRLNISMNPCLSEPHNDLSGFGERFKKNIMKARRTEDLKTCLDSLKQDVYGQQILQGARQTDSMKLSVRHFLVQHNYIIEDAEGNIDPVQSIFEIQLDANGNPSASQPVSDGAWLAFLQSHCLFDPRINAKKLEFAFSTSLNANFSNPLHNPYARGILLSWNGDKPSEQNGVTINITGRSLSIGADERVRINLKQEGSSLVRFSKWDTNPLAMRFWNLESVMSNVIAAINGKAPTVLSGDTYRPSTPQFHERSPANDRWVLTIRGDMGGGVNAKLLNQLDKITDMEITFDVTYFTPAYRREKGTDGEQQM